MAASASAAPKAAKRTPEDLLVAAKKALPAAPFGTPEPTPRLLKEWEDIVNGGATAPGILIEPRNAGLRAWDVYIRGPPSSAFEGGEFHVEFTIPPEYPIKPVQAVMRTPIVHCNFNAGSICLDILKDKWSPALRVTAVALSIQQLLEFPEWTNPYSGEALDHYRKDKTGQAWFLRAAQETQGKAPLAKFAGKPDPFAKKAEAASATAAAGAASPVKRHR
jgi:ubiquitin-protein ligase